MGLQQGVDLDFRCPALGVTVVDQPWGHARGFGRISSTSLPAADLAQGRRRSVALQEPADGLMVQTRAENTFRAWVALGEAGRESGWRCGWTWAARSWAKPTRRSARR